MNIVEVLLEMFRPFFRNLGTWAAWIAILKAIFALPMEPGELEVYRRHTGRQDPPSSPAREAWLVVGRRGGKSRIAALIAVFLACFRDYSGVLSPGERGTVMVIAADRKQARITLRYIVAFLEGIPMLKALIERKTAEEIDLSNGITIEVHTCNFRAIRGYSVVAAVFDEVAYWRSEESANPDVEIANSIRPAMATVPGALLLGISSPYARRGLLWEMHRAHYGKDGDEILVVQADTGSMNPTVDKAVIARAYEEDEAVAAAEFGAEFRRDLEAFISREVVDSCIVAGRHELPPRGLQYVSFCDPSGGSGGDSFTMAIAHAEGDKRVLDLIRERRPPLSPEVVVKEFSEVLKQYGIATVRGDKDSAQFVVEAFARHGIRYESSAGTRSEIYLEALGPLNSGRFELLDNERMASQFVRLERRTGRGRDSVDHPPGQHDDLSNSVCGALVMVSQAQTSPGFFFCDLKISSRSDAWANAEDLD